MADLDDVDLGHDEQAQPPPAPARDGPPLGLVALVVVLVGAIAVVGGLAFRKSPPSSPTPSPAAATTTPDPTPSPSPSSASIAPLPSGVPALDASDSFVRELAKGLSTHPQLALWLAAHDLVRTLTVVIENVANGQTPRVHLGFLSPKEPFAVLQKQGRLVIDPRSYARYDDLVDGLASLDSDGCVTLYRRLEPLFDAAYRDLGYPEGGFRSALGRALAMLEAAPTLDGDVGVSAVKRARVVYEYEDRRVESLTAAQKQLVRLGPRNVRKVQAKLRALRNALDVRVP
jgi:Protein of unknown function (DUF3014)